MPRHLIGDAHEWLNAIPTVPTRSRVNLQPSQRSWDYLCVKHRFFFFFFFLFVGMVNGPINPACCCEDAPQDGALLG